MSQMLIVNPNLYWTEIIPLKGTFYKKRHFVTKTTLFFSLCFPQLLSRKDKATFERLEYLMSKEDNYKRLRDYISSQSMTSCIPYLGIFSLLSCLQFCTHTNHNLLGRPFPVCYTSSHTTCLADILINFGF